jgi:hypothetical protein
MSLQCDLCCGLGFIPLFAFIVLIKNKFKFLILTCYFILLARLGRKSYNNSDSFWLRLEHGILQFGVEYGIHSLMCMVDSKGDAREMSVREIADLQSVPYDYLAKIFTRLSKAGLVRSIEGKGGGFPKTRRTDNGPGCGQRHRW